MRMIIIDGHYLMHVNMLSMKNRPRRIAACIYLCFFFTLPSLFNQVQIHTRCHTECRVAAAKPATRALQANEGPVEEGGVPQAQGAGREEQERSADGGGQEEGGQHV